MLFVVSAITTLVEPRHLSRERVHASPPFLHHSCFSLAIVFRSIPPLLIGFLNCPADTDHSTRPPIPLSLSFSALAYHRWIKAPVIRYCDQPKSVPNPPQMFPNIRIQLAAAAVPVLVTPPPLMRVIGRFGLTAHQRLC